MGRFLLLCKVKIRTLSISKSLEFDVPFGAAFSRLVWLVRSPASMLNELSPGPLMVVPTKAEDINAKPDTIAKPVIAFLTALLLDACYFMIFTP